MLPDKDVAVVFSELSQRFSHLDLNEVLQFSVHVTMNGHAQLRFHLKRHFLHTLDHPDHFRQRVLLFRCVVVLDSL